MIQRIVEAILRPVLNLAATLMANLFLAPFRALFGPKPDEEEDDERREIPEDEEPKQLEDSER